MKKSIKEDLYLQYRMIVGIKNPGKKVIDRLIEGVIQQEKQSIIKWAKDILAIQKLAPKDKANEGYNKAMYDLIDFLNK